MQQPIPSEYQKLTDTEAASLVANRKDELGDRIAILGHHYQHDEIVRFADHVGDSLELSQIASGQRAEYIIFCGVHFMAESADILTSDAQKVLMPDTTAGCPMADMATFAQVEQCWQVLQSKLGNPEKVVPVTYVNSTAEIKAFCGKHGGMCCTSGNAQAILANIYDKDADAVVLFLPDQHLGRNTAFAMGYPLEAMVLWNRDAPDGGVEDALLKNIRIILWDGYCPVHQEFNTDQIASCRSISADINIIVHPECPFDIVQQASHVGSTSYIIKTINAAAPNSSWAVGTEINLVNRLARQARHRNINVVPLSDSLCICETMSQTDLQHLGWLLDVVSKHIATGSEGHLPNQITVESAIKQDARVALEKMLKFTTAVAQPGQQ